MIPPLHIVLQRLRRDGVSHMAWLIAGRIRLQFRSFVEDARRGVSTAREVDDYKLGFLDSRFHAYVATDYRTLKTAFGHIQVRAAEDVFVDFGSGKGRVVMLAAELPFHRVTGIEFSEQLHDQALQNLRSLRNRVCQNVELICIDARDWKIPHDATVLFFFNPFEGEVLAKVCANIRQSLAEVPRKITIIYVRADKFFEKEIKWKEWLTRTAEFPCSDGKVANPSYG